MAVNKIGLFDMLGSGYKAIGMGFQVTERVLNTMDNLAAVGELKSKSMLNEAELEAEERMQMLRFKMRESALRIQAEEKRLESSLRTQAEEKKPEPTLNQ